MDSEILFQIGFFAKQITRPFEKKKKTHSLVEEKTLEERVKKEIRQTPPLSSSNLSIELRMKYLGPTSES